MGAAALLELRRKNRWADLALVELTQTLECEVADEVEAVAGWGLPADQVVLRLLKMGRSLPEFIARCGLGMGLVDRLRTLLDIIHGDRDRERGQPNVGI